jgi:hypothetical protein
MLSDMTLRDASFPVAVPSESVTTGTTPDDARCWRVSGPLTAFKAAGVLLFTCAALVSAGQPVGVATTLFAGVALAGSVIRDLLVPIRVGAGHDGLVVVTGFVGRRTLPWHAVTRIQVDERRRLGTRSRLLEIETEESLYLFGRSELTAPVESVAEELRSMWATRLAADPAENEAGQTGA